MSKKEKSNIPKEPKKVKKVSKNKMKKMSGGVKSVQENDPGDYLG